MARYVRTFHYKVDALAYAREVANQPDGKLRGVEVGKLRRSGWFVRYDNEFPIASGDRLVSVEAKPLYSTTQS